MRVDAVSEGVIGWEDGSGEGDGSKSSRERFAMIIESEGGEL